MKDFEIRCDESRLETTNLIYGKFTLGPFLPGQATTFGNALRRSLLAELSGLAITAFEIIGVMQEFSTLPGLRESILDLSLNLKQIVLTGVLPHSTPPIGFLNVRGPAIIKANDLKLPAGVYCASPDQYIATLGSNGMLHFKFIVSVGKGYSIQPYSIYRSLSKIRLQPASNFDNIVVISDSVREGDKQLLTSYAASCAKQSVGVKDQFRTPRSFHEVRACTSTESEATQSKEGLVKQQEYKISPIPRYFEELTGKSLSSGDGFISEKTKKEGFAYSEEAKQSKIDKTKLKEGLSYNVEHLEREITNDALSTKPQTFNSLLTSKNNKDLENSLMSFAQPAFDSGEVKGKLTPQKPSSKIKGFEATGFAELKSKEGLIPLRPLLASLPSGYTGQKLENLDSSQSTFFTDEKNSSYINIQTQLFQRITPHQVLPIDAVFTPVSQVNFLTEVNDRFETARENIVLEIWTNGSIHPKRALEEATLSLVQNFDTLLKKIQQASSFYKGLRYWTYLHPFKSFRESPTESVATPVESQPRSFLTKQHITSNEPLYFPPDTGLTSNMSAKKGELFRAPYRSAKPTESESVPFTSAASDSSHLRKNKITRSVKTEGGVHNELGFGNRNPIIEELLKKDLPHAIYNLDIGNLNLSLQTFIFLKKAKIHTLLQLLTQFSSATDSSQFRKNFVNRSVKINQSNICNLLNEKIVEELNNVIRQFGYEE